MPALTADEKDRLETEATLREAFGLRVYVVGGDFLISKMLHEAGFKGARSVGDSDIICFTGGSDVDPSLYGEEALPETDFTPERDKREAVIYSEAMKLCKPMIGICRGSQFLNVMNGGKLWQHVNNHGRQHSVLDLKTGEMRHDMTSTHHQQMIPTKDGEVLALACESTYKASEKNKVERKNPDTDDVEVVWYPDSLSLCFQPHPEYLQGGCRNYFLELIDEYVMPAC